MRFAGTEVEAALRLLSYQGLVDAPAVAPGSRGGGQPALTARFAASLEVRGGRGWTGVEGGEGGKTGGGGVEAC